MENTSVAERWVQLYPVILFYSNDESSARRRRYNKWASMKDHGRFWFKINWRESRTSQWRLVKWWHRGGADFWKGPLNSIHRPAAHLMSCYVNDRIIIIFIVVNCHAIIDAATTAVCSIKERPCCFMLLRHLTRLYIGGGWYRSFNINWGRKFGIHFQLVLFCWLFNLVDLPIPHLFNYLPSSIHSQLDSYTSLNSSAKEPSQ